MTQGEKLVWAAAYARGLSQAFQVSAVEGKSLEGEEVQVDAAVSAAICASYAVITIRADAVKKEIEKRDKTASIRMKEALE